MRTCGEVELKADIVGVSVGAEFDPDATSDGRKHSGNISTAESLCRRDSTAFSVQLRQLYVQQARQNSTFSPSLLAIVRNKYKTRTTYYGHKTNRQNAQAVGLLA